MICVYLQASRFEYACKACGHKAGAKRNLRKHMRSVHPSLLQVRLPNWSKHIQTVLQYNTCTSCEFTTPWKASLRHHEKQHDLPEDWSKVVCHHCPFFYRYFNRSYMYVSSLACAKVKEWLETFIFRHDPLEPKAKRKCEQLLNQVPDKI